MIKAVLKRMRSGDEGTFGVLVLRDGARELTLCTAELPWRENLPRRSCIPAGKYRAVMTRSARFGVDLYEIDQVPGRTGIRIHAGNFAGNTEKGLRSDVEGCILVGMRHGRLSGQRVVLESRTALAALHRFTAGAALDIEVMEG